MFRYLSPIKVSFGITVSEIFNGLSFIHLPSRFSQYVWRLQFSTSPFHSTTDQYQSKHVSVDFF